MEEKFWILKQCKIWFFKLIFVQLTENSFGIGPKPDLISMQNFLNDSLIFRWKNMQRREETKKGKKWLFFYFA